jgi:hypothetical protein
LSGGQLAGDQFVRTTFAKRALRQRVVALAAACAIALSGLMTSLAAAQAAAEAINQPDVVICHGNSAKRQAPVPDESSGKICVASCCVGCLSMAAAVPPPTATAVAAHSLSQWPALFSRFVLAAGTDFNAHRPRGPPSAL